MGADTWPGFRSDFGFAGSGRSLAGQLLGANLRIAPENQCVDAVHADTPRLRPGRCRCAPGLVALAVRRRRSSGATYAAQCGGAEVCLEEGTKAPFLLCGLQRPAEIPIQGVGLP